MNILFSFLGVEIMLFNNMTVIVTGGSQGIGKSIVQSYLKEGAHVFVADIAEPSYLKGEEKITYIKTDVSNESDIKKMIECVFLKNNRIDILINNAGKSLFKSPFDLTLDEWDDILNTNLRSVFIASREAGKYMKEAKRGSIINISSTRSIMSEENSEAYAASKGGINALTHAFAASFAKYNIQVNCISPGWIQTSKKDEIREIDHKQHFSGRVGRPEDIARACLYLSSAGNQFVSGVNLVIDGGMTKKMIYEP